ncbi:MAG TPA: NifU family protein [Ilumatobacteraceae bacterium]|nr:NifU family protein [Ilumatobacteraceae bacterium]
MDESSAFALVQQFSRMVRRDGGELTLLGVTDDELRVSYRPGIDASCDDDGCVLPQIELRQLMSETLAHRAPGVNVVIEVVE